MLIVPVRVLLDNSLLAGCNAQLQSVYVQTAVLFPPRLGFALLSKAMVT